MINEHTEFLICSCQLYRAIGSSAEGRLKRMEQLELDLTLLLSFDILLRCLQVPSAFGIRIGLRGLADWGRCSSTEVLL